MSDIDAGLVRRWVRGATDALRRERAALDHVNVFPVADSDTGTNMYLTLREGERAVRTMPDDAAGADLLGACARAALLGARGNSGVILSEWLRGTALAARDGATAATILEEAARSARAAVASPADGTILTAADAAATAARATEDAGQGPAAIARAAVGAAREAARASMTEHPVLAAAGVLDAGACGLVLVLGAFAEAAMSDSPGRMSPVSLDLVVERPAGRQAAAGTPPAPGGHGRARAGQGGLELMFVVTRDAEGAGDVAPRLRSRLEEVGDSVVVVGGDTGAGSAVWQAHVHTDDLPAALGVAAGAGGRLAQVHVRHLEAADHRGHGVVAITSAPALAADIAHAGAVVLLGGGFGATVDAVSPQDVQRAADSTGACRVLVLGPAPRADAARADLDEITPLDTPTDVHVVVALAALGTAPEAADPVALMDAVLAGLYVAGPVPAGRAATALTEAVARLAAAGTAPEVVTVLADDDATDAAAGLAPLLARLAPSAELVALPTGRPGSEIRLGLEGPAGTTSSDIDAPPIGAGMPAGPPGEETGAMTRDAVLRERA
ncbi:DAK2 domain-containing protein [Myceligenerans crystallogenes]|uniref:DAK2 domain-containing protein n=1 Tax=Myceligenerans crystallogenes TaxID=316335 RepID=UPI0031D9D696